MTIIFCLIAVLFASLAFNHFVASFSEWEIVGILGVIASALGLLLCAFTIPLERLSTKAQMQSFHAVMQSRSMTEGSPEIEAAAWRMKVAESNAWLAATKYYNGTVFDIWIPDEIETLQPIE